MIRFRLQKGEVFGVFGPNGAGKTTLVSQISGFTKPTKGTIQINGMDVIKQQHIARKLCTYQPQQNISLSGLTPRQAIELAGRMRGGHKNDVRERTIDLLERLKLKQWEHTDIEKLSGEIRRLVTFVWQ